MEQLKVELPKEVTDAIKAEVIQVFQDAKNDTREKSFPLYMVLCPVKFTL